MWNGAFHGKLLLILGFIINELLGLKNVPPWSRILSVLTIRHVGLLSRPGLHQGDPLSPYLFILFMEVLATRLQTQAELSKSGLNVNILAMAQKLPCLFYADDSMFFCKVYSTTELALKSILNCFSSQSGQLVNFHKSAKVFSVNTTQRQK